MSRKFSTNPRFEQAKGLVRGMSHWIDRCKKGYSIKVFDGGVANIDSSLRLELSTLADKVHYYESLATHGRGRRKPGQGFPAVRFIFYMNYLKKYVVVAGENRSKEESIYYTTTAESNEQAQHNVAVMLWGEQEQLKDMFPKFEDYFNEVKCDESSWYLYPVEAVEVE